MDLAAVGPRTVDNLNPIVENRRRGRVLFDEVLPLKLGPKLRRDCRLHGTHIGEDLRLGMRADDQRHRNVWRGRELNWRSLSRFSMYSWGMFQGRLAGSCSAGCRR